MINVAALVCMLSPHSKCKQDLLPHGDMKQEFGDLDMSGLGFLPRNSSKYFNNTNDLEDGR